MFCAIGVFPLYSEFLFFIYGLSLEWQFFILLRVAFEKSASSFLSINLVLNSCIEAILFFN